MDKLNTHKGSVLRIINGLLSFIISANLLMLVFYNTVTYRLFFHSDSAAKSLIAGEIFRTGEFFPKDWNYVNGDLFVIFGHLFVLPFLPFLKNGFALHAVSGLISAGLIVVSVWFLLIVLEVSTTARLFFLALLTTGISPYLAENLFGQVSYGAVLYLAVLQLYFVVLYLKRCEVGAAKNTTFPVLAFGIIVFLVFLSNPARALASYTLPLFSGLLFVSARESILNEYVLPNGHRRGIIILISVMFFAGIVGGVCHRLVLAIVNNSMQAADARFLAYEDVVRNFVETIRGWLFLVGGGTTKGRAILSRMGLYESLHLIFTLILLMTPFFWFVTIWREKSPYLSLVTVFTIVSLAIVAFLHIFTTIPDMSDPLMSSRYFAVAVIMMLIVLFVKGDFWITSHNIQMVHSFIVVLLLPFLLSGYLILVLPALGKDMASGKKRLSIKPAPFDGIIEVLGKNKLSYGFASYWNANVISVLSSGETKIRPVHLMGLPKPMRHLSSNEWYRATAYEGRTFFLLYEREYKAINWDAMEAYLGRPERELIEADWRVVVYPFNVAGRLPGWQLGRSIDAPLAHLHKIVLISYPLQFVSGKSATFEVEVQNLSNEVYSSHGGMPVNLGVHLSDEKGKMINFDFWREPLRGDLPPGQKQRIAVPIRIEQPGDYKLSFDLVQEGVTWFAARDSFELVVDVRVRP